MKFLLPILTLLFLSFGEMSGIEVPHEFNQQQLVNLYDSLSNPSLDNERVIDVHNYIISRGGQEIRFISGILRFFKPVSGQLFGAVFTGTGTFTQNVPTLTEKVEFERQTERKLTNDCYAYAFSSAVLWFHDSILTETKHFIPQQQKIDRKERELVERSCKYAIDPANDNVIYRLIDERLQPSPGSYLFAHFVPNEGKEIFLTYDPRRFEEIVIHNLPYDFISGSVFWLHILNSYHLPGEYTLSNEYQLAREDKNPIDIIENNIDFSIKKGGAVSGKAEVFYRAKYSNLPTVILLLDPLLVIDSVQYPDGKSLSFLRAKKDWHCFIFTPPQDSLSYHLIFSYHSDSFLDNAYQHASTSGWYPQSSDIDRMIFKVTYNVPKHIELVASGEKIGDKEIGDMKTLQYTSVIPVINASFATGFFKSQTVRLTDNETPITVYDFRDRKLAETGKDLANSVRLYTFLYGSSPCTEFKATLGTLGHGESFQDMIYLPRWEEYVGEKQSAVALVKAHEIAHAWWGAGVVPSSYHDWWICEALAEYSALLYAPFVLKDHKAFFDKLKDWKEKIVGARKYALASGPPLGSIWLGYRTSTYQTPEDYSLLAYLKGAWFIHMLRMMMVDFSTMNEDNFKAMLSEFYQTYYGREASTLDFKKIVEKYFKMDMGWFFEQWIFQNDLPTLKCTHSVQRKENGKIDLKITIQKEAVPDSFKIYLPFQLNYPNGTNARARLLVDKHMNEYHYELGQEPTDIEFNLMESVLCTIEE
jgi:hypothetical protein